MKGCPFFGFLGIGIRGETTMDGFIDIHSHILPELDDGARNLDESREMLHTAYKEGIRVIIATPHFHESRFRSNRRARIEESVFMLREAIRETMPDMEIYSGCEIRYSHETIRLLDEMELATLAGTRYVLTEFSESETSADIFAGLQELLFAGYIPILAHVERYGSLFEKSTSVRGLIEMGVYIQVDAASITGEMGRTEKRIVKKLLKNGEIHIIATDAHRSEARKPHLRECARILEKKYGDDTVRQLLIENPGKILKNEYI